MEGNAGGGGTPAPTQIRVLDVVDPTQPTPTQATGPDVMPRRPEVDPRTIIANALVHTPSGVLEPGWVSLRGRTIEAVGPGLPPPLYLPADVVLDAGGWSLVPGFIDLHIHGAVGREAMDADPDGLRAISRFLVRHGVTAFLPTTWAASGRKVMAVLEAVAEVLGEAEGGATILGAHLEGPYLNPRRCGAQPADSIRPPDRAECQLFLESGVVRILTLAPELEGALALVGDCAERGVVAAAGHTEATYEEMQVAVSAGVSQVTHLFNAMGGLSHRAPGAAGAALALDGLRCELIADGAHVHPAALRVAWRSKGVDGLILVSDATRAAGLPDGEVDLAGRRGVSAGGTVRLADGTLAGSAGTLDAGLSTFAAATGATVAQLWPLVSANAASAIGFGERKGTITVNRDADLVLLDGEGVVRLTVVEGKTVYSDLSRRSSPGPAHS